MGGLDFEPRDSSRERIRRTGAKARRAEPKSAASSDRIKNSDAIFSNGGSSLLNQIVRAGSPASIIRDLKRTRCSVVALSTKSKTFKYSVATSAQVLDVTHCCRSVGGAC